MSRDAPEVASIDDPLTLARYFSRDRALHIYELGDLDPFFWPHTSWWGLRDPAAELLAVALLYRAPKMATVVALGPSEEIGELLIRIEPALPDRFHAHTSPGAIERLRHVRRVESRGAHIKMALTDPGRLGEVETAGVEALGTEHLPELHALYARAYPENWFDPRMLETGWYVGARRAGILACVAGVHVHSSRYGVAALGNIATDPDHRRQGLASRATAHLCRALLASVEVVGLNVRADNAPARACYQGLGFREIAAYEESTVSR